MKKNSRRRVYINTRLIAVCTIAFFVFFALLFGVIGRVNVAASENPSVKCFTSIQIENGDTLTSIAYEYMDSHYSNAQAYMEEVKQMNGLTSDTLHAGDYITVPYFVDEDI